MVSGEVLHGIECLAKLVRVVGAVALLDRVVKQRAVNVEVILDGVRLLGNIDKANLLPLVNVLGAAQARLHERQQLRTAEAVLGPVVGEPAD